jgi:UDP-4-amino-4,6-dideoxy-N-acetyl-beta-L-altrosamine transaminase
LIPYGRHDISSADIDEVVKVLKSDFITQGPSIEVFEDALKGVCGAEFAVAMNSATSALHASYLALGLKPGDTVWTSPITFVATANSAIYCGATVDFVDIDLTTFNISVSALREKLELARENGCLPDIVSVVHLAGQSSDMREIWELSKIYGFSIVEDASHAVGGSYLSNPIGSCQFSDITVFSFHPVKIVTTGEGGAAVTNDPSLAAKLRLLRSHGITRDTRQMLAPTDDPWYYEQVELGFNYRMTDLQAALGTSQLKRLGQFIDRRNSIAQFYSQVLQADHLELPQVMPDRKSAFHLYVIRINESLKLSSCARRRLIIAQLHDSGVSTNLHYIPVYRQPFYAKMGYRWTDFTNAERYFESALTIPLYAGMSDADVEYVAEAVGAALQSTSS